MNVVLSFGLGVDSTALLLRWLEEPDCRTFELDDLLVISAMTGDEWPRTAVLVQDHILPRIRQAGLRYAQVARRGAKQAEGIEILEDSVSPTRLHVAGAYKLSDELTVAGTIPQAGGNRRCSMKFKGWPIDTYLARHAPKATRHAFGYEAGEIGRAERCAERMPGRLVLGFERGEGGRARTATEYDTPHRVAEFPLIEWGWDRGKCQEYIRDVTGVADWPKSACVYCPFALTSRAGRERTLRRYDTRPESALEALMLERRSLCLNPRGGLIAGDRLSDLIEVHRPNIATVFAARLDKEPHAVYEVRRVWRPRAKDPSKANANRHLRVVSSGSRSECEAAVRALGPVDRGGDGIERAYHLRRGESPPTREHFTVAGPAGAEAKALSSFERWWSEVDQLALTLR